MDGRAGSGNVQARPARLTCVNMEPRGSGQNPRQYNGFFYSNRRAPVELLYDLFSSDYGLMSIIGIAMMVVASVAFVVVLKRKIEADPGPSDKQK